MVTGLTLTKETLPSSEPPRSSARLERAPFVFAEETTRPSTGSDHGESVRMGCSYNFAYARDR